MKKTLTLLTLGFMVSGFVGCSSAPKKEEVSEETTVSASTELEQEEEAMPLEETAAPETSTSSTTSDLSLGAGSSGRGH